MSNYLDAADTDDEDEKCVTTCSPEEIADGEARCAALKGDRQRVQHRVDSYAISMTGNQLLQAGYLVAVTTSSSSPLSLSSSSAQGYTAFLSLFCLLILLLPRILPHLFLPLIPSLLIFLLAHPPSFPISTRQFCLLLF